MIQRLAVALGLTVLVPLTALAQAPAESSGLRREALPTVFVLDDRGVETRGKLLRLDSEAVVLLVADAERRFDIRSVTRVDERGDSLKNGAIIGAVIGAVLGGLASAMSECVSNGHVTSCGVGARLAMGAISTGLYAAVGAGIDAAIPGRRRLYDAPGGGRGASLALRVRW